MEANPGTFEAEKFKSYRASGVNRLSIGIQSFNERHLKALGRIHDDNEARRAVEIALANFDNFNLDLMYALPSQTLEEARRISRRRWRSIRRTCRCTT
jgi:oxygen-independent coproporphyrinogen-3 oxidase